MSNTNDALSKKPWTDTEKLALLVAVAASFGPPDWKRVEIPEGRTAIACRKMYAILTKDLPEGTPRKKGAGKPKLRTNKDDSVPLTPKPRVNKRKHNEAVEGYESDGIDDYGDDGKERSDAPVVKKCKMEIFSEEESTVKFEDYVI